MTQYNYSTDYAQLFDLLQEGFEAVAFAENNAYRISIRKFLPSEVNRIAFVSEIGLFSVSNEITAFKNECNNIKLRWIDPQPKVKELGWREKGSGSMATCGGFSFLANDNGHLELWFNSRCIEYHTSLETRAAAKEFAQNWANNHVNQFLQ